MSCFKKADKLLDEQLWQKVKALECAPQDTVEKGSDVMDLQGKSDDPGVFPVFVAVNNKIPF